MCQPAVPRGGSKQHRARSGDACSHKRYLTPSLEMHATRESTDTDSGASLHCLYFLPTVLHCASAEPHLTQHRTRAPRPPLGERRCCGRPQLEQHVLAWICSNDTLMIRLPCYDSAVVAKVVCQTCRFYFRASQWRARCWGSRCALQQL